MTRIEQIRREARDIQNLLECTTVSDIDSMVRRLDQLGVYYARSGALLSEVVGMRDAAVAKLFDDERGYSYPFPVTCEQTDRQCVFRAECP